MDLFMNETLQTINRVAENHVECLCASWADIAGPFEGVAFQSQLKKHCADFFQQITKESVDKKKDFIKWIADLDKEKRQLEHCLGLPATEVTNEPLFKQCRKLRSIVSGLRLQFEPQAAEFKKLLDEEKLLCIELEDTAIGKDKQYTTVADVALLKNQVELLKRMRADRTKLMEEAQAAIAELEQRVVPRTLVIPCDLRPTLNNTNDWSAALEAHKNEKRKLDVKGLTLKMTKLWQSLKVPKFHQEAVLSGNFSTQQALEKLQLEVERCEILKLAQLPQKFEDLRAKIVDWSIKCKKEQNYGSETFGGIIYDESVLQRMEAELEELKHYYKENKTLLKHLQDRDELMKQLTAVENKAKDPSCLKNRGGTLLKIENERKGLTHSIVEVEKSLAKLLQSYLDKFGSPFCVFNKPVSIEVSVAPRLKRSDSNLKLKPFGSRTQNDKKF